MKPEKAIHGIQELVTWCQRHKKIMFRDKKGVWEPVGTKMILNMKLGYVAGILKASRLREYSE